MARSNAEIALLKKTFQGKYGDDLVKVLSKELSGDLKKVILTAMRGEVADFNASVHTSVKASTDADTLYKAGQGRTGVDETTFINILVLSPAEHVRGINSAYEAKYKTNLMGAIEAEFSGDAKRAMLFLNAYGLNALVVRYYRLLKRIRIVYTRLYHQELRTRIQGVVSGEYCQLLLSTLDAAEVEFGASASVTTSACADTALLYGTSASGTSTTVSATIAAVGGAVVGSSSSVKEETGVSSGATVDTTWRALASSETATAVAIDDEVSHRTDGRRQCSNEQFIRALRRRSSACALVLLWMRLALASLLLSKSVEQRYLIWWRYRTLYKQSLTMWIKSTSDYGVLLKMLASPLEQVEAEILQKATKGLGTTEEWIYPVVMARSNAEIALLKKTFQEKYGDDLVKVLSKELSGDLKKVILTAMRGEVADFNASVHTSVKASTDADTLYKAGQGRTGVDETTFINILVLSPAEHVHGINTRNAVPGAVGAGAGESACGAV
ncbi:unnamed protein product [Peronospora belbahrii]|uniref:Annexin n=1 Tax=Peronospora belbahrii TaxID=622444 RepID=A0ABN8CLZ3_9STRA|nr:unnamed protein product [Peronospora belbahrii]